MIRAVKEIEGFKKVSGGDGVPMQVLGGQGAPLSVYSEKVPWHR